jgi:hypothetical protein
MSEDRASVERRPPEDPPRRRSMGFVVVAAGAVVLLLAPLSTLVGGDTYFQFGMGFVESVAYYWRQLLVGAIPGLATAIVLAVAVRRRTAMWPLVLLALGGVATVAFAIVAYRWVGTRGFVMNKEAALHLGTLVESVGGILVVLGAAIEGWARRSAPQGAE